MGLAIELFHPPPPYATDFAEIKGQEHVKRALEIAAAGSHNVLMLGTKSRRIHRLSPPLVSRS